MTIRHRRHGWLWHLLHRNRTALVAPTEHAGATEEWSPKAELARADAYVQPEETADEAVVRAAEEIVDHWAAEEARIEAEVRGWFDEFVKDDPIAAQLLTEAREREARKASTAAADAAYRPTGEYPMVRELVTA